MPFDDMAAVTADAPLTSRPHFQDPSAPNPVPTHAGDIPTNGRGPHDELEDDLFNYNPNVGEPFRDAGANNTTAPTSGNTVNVEEDRGLGIDDEVKVRKPRRPVAKLDEDRLLGRVAVREAPVAFVDVEAGDLHGGFGHQHAVEDHRARRGRERPGEPH